MRRDAVEGKKVSTRRPGSTIMTSSSKASVWARAVVGLLAVAFGVHMLRPQLSALAQRAKIWLINLVVNKTVARLTTTAGHRCELGLVDCGPELGGEMVCFVNAPRNLAAVYALSRAHGEAEFVVQLGDEAGSRRRLSYAQALEEAGALEAALATKLGVRAGDRVSILMSNIAEYPLTFMAVTQMGAVAVTLNAFWSAETLEYGLDKSGSTVLVADDKRLARLAAGGALARLVQGGLRVVVVRRNGGAGVAAGAAGVHDFGELLRRGKSLAAGGGYARAREAAPSDAACIMFTSGTTGRFPKGVVLSHRSFCQATWAYVMFADLLSTLKGQQVAPRCDLITSPLFHAAQFSSSLLVSFVCRHKLVLLPRWNVEAAIDAMLAERVTFIGVMPTMLCDLLRSERFRAEAGNMVLTNVGTGGAPCPSEFMKRLVQVVPHITQGSGWGMTETNSIGTIISGPEYILRFLSCGRAQRIVQVKTIDPHTLQDLPADREGELLIRTVCRMDGYWNMPKETSETLHPGGWVRTGDLGRVDPDGLVYITDRIKDLINYAGEKISANEVEDALLACDAAAITEVAVFGLPEERYGEQVAAAVCLLPGASLSPDALRLGVAARLAKHCVPTKIFLRNAATEPLPRGPTGKVLKRELRELYKTA